MVHTVAGIWFLLGRWCGSSWLEQEERALHLKQREELGCVRELSRYSVECDVLEKAV